MTLAQIQNLQAFFITEMSDVIDASKHVSPDPKHKQSGDMAHVLIKTPFNEYEMSVRSTYIEPPPGAPFECRSLGTVTFDDVAGSKHVVGPKSDKTYSEISKYIHEREYKDAVAAARRELAEASPEMVSAARVKLVGLAERAVKWGIKVHVPAAPADLAAPPTQVRMIDKETAAELFPSAPGKPVDDAPHPSTDSSFSSALISALSKNPYRSEAVGQVGEISKIISPSTKPNGMTPWLGCPIVFVTNPGEAVSGMSEIPGWVVKVHSADRVSIFITPDNSEVAFRDNLPRRGSPAGNGRTHQHGCWDFNPEVLRQHERIRGLEEQIEKLGSPTVVPEVMSHDSQNMLLKLEARIDKLEPNRIGSMDPLPPERDIFGLIHKLDERIDRIAEEYSQVRSAFSALARRVGALEGQRKSGPKPKPKSVEPPQSAA